MFKVLVEERAVVDIQSAIDFYATVSPALGKKFEKALEKEIMALSFNPFYQIKYKTFRCKMIKKFPYLIHYAINTRLQEVYLFGVICTHKNPKTTWL